MTIDRRVNRLSYRATLVKYTGFFFLSIRTRNGPTGAPFILSTCDLLQIVAIEKEFCLIYDTWYFISYEKYEKRRFESMRF